MDERMAQLVQTGPVRAQGLVAAVAASRSWYDDIFDLHRITVGTDGALWWAEGAPPRWHSAVKTLVPTTDPSGALLRMEPHQHGTIADSFGLLDLTSRGSTCYSPRHGSTTVALQQPPRHPSSG